LKDRTAFPLKVIIVCSPANPSGKVMSPAELEAIAERQRIGSLVVDEVYEHYVLRKPAHTDRLPPGMWSVPSRSTRSQSRGISQAGSVTHTAGQPIAPINAVANAYVPGDTFAGGIIKGFDGDAGYYPATRQV
jgi:hypothetical protein